MNPELRRAISDAGVWSHGGVKWQQQQSFFNDHHFENIVKPDPGMDECWAGLDAGAYGDQLGYGYMNQNTVLKVTDRSAMAGDHMFVHGNSSSVSVSPRKRKADKGQTLLAVSEKEKKIKPSPGDSKITQQNSNSNSNSSNNNNGNTKTASKDKSKVSEVPKTDYIHVRARRGQATDSHSLAERVRREKISERMKYLQDLVPGCNKITGKAGMLDEIINYVQSLQKQVEFLSMKLATVNSEIDFNNDKVFESSTSELQALACSSANSAYFDQYNSMEQVVSYHGLDMGINSAEMGLRRSISAPISLPETFMDSSCFNVISSDLSNLFFEL